jgi:hypothetical protein
MGTIDPLKIEKNKANKKLEGNEREGKKGEREERGE